MIDGGRPVAEAAVSTLKIYCSRCGGPAVCPLATDHVRVDGLGTLMSWTLHPPVDDEYCCWPDRPVWQLKKPTRGVA
jgi:hypothetical protein